MKKYLVLLLLISCKTQKVVVKEPTKIIEAKQTDSLFINRRSFIIVTGYELKNNTWVKTFDSTIK